MPNVVILDTDIIIDYMRGDEGALTYVDSLLEGTRPIAVSAMTIMQLHHGVVRSSKTDQELERIEASLDAVPTYPMDEAIAARAGELDGILTEKGEPIGVSDTIIGATALQRDEAVATRNKRHFRRIPGLDIETI